MLVSSTGQALWPPRLLRPPSNTVHSFGATFDYGVDSEHFLLPDVDLVSLRVVVQKSVQKKPLTKSPGRAD
jgi:hypothetical protein